VFIVPINVRIIKSMFLSKLQLEMLYSLSCVNQMGKEDEIEIHNDAATLYLISKKKYVGLIWDKAGKFWKETVKVG
jgi:hypothetical protein